MSPRTPEQNQALRNESRLKIIEAALRLFGSHGYERSTVRMIAQKAGIAQGLMYSHFASKEELLRAIFEQSMQEVFASFALAASDNPSSDTVERIIRAAFQVLQQRLDFWRLSYAVRMQPAVLAALGDELPAWITSVRATLERAFQAADVPAPAVEAELLFATIDGVAQHYVLDPTNYPLEAVIEILTARYRSA